MLRSPDLAVGEFSFFVTELLVFTVLLRVASSAAGLDSDTELAVTVCLAKDFTTGLGLTLENFGTAFDIVGRRLGLLLYLCGKFLGCPTCFFSYGCVICESAGLTRVLGLS